MCFPRKQEPLLGTLIRDEELVFMCTSEIISNASMLISDHQRSSHPSSQRHGRGKKLLTLLAPNCDQSDQTCCEADLGAEPPESRFRGIRWGNLHHFSRSIRSFGNCFFGLDSGTNSPSPGNSRGQITARTQGVTLGSFQTLRPNPRTPSPKPRPQAGPRGGGLHGPKVSIN